MSSHFFPLAATIGTAVSVVNGHDKRNLCAFRDLAAILQVWKGASEALEISDLRAASTATSELSSYLITKKESADKPGSVVGNHSSGMHVAVHLERPTRKRARAARCGLRRMLPYLALLQAGFAVPSPLPSTRCALTAPFHPCRRACARLGGLLSVALSVGSRPPGVTWRRTLWSPDFPPFSRENGGCLADSRYQHSGNGHAPQAESPRFASPSSSARA